RTSEKNRPSEQSHIRLYLSLQKLRQLLRLNRFSDGWIGRIHIIAQLHQPQQQLDGVSTSASDIGRRDLHSDPAGGSTGVTEELAGALQCMSLAAFDVDLDSKDAAGG